MKIRKIHIIGRILFVIKIVRWIILIACCFISAATEFSNSAIGHLDGSYIWSVGLAICLALSVAHKYISIRVVEKYMTCPWCHSVSNNLEYTFREGILPIQICTNCKRNFEMKIEE